MFLHLLFRKHPFIACLIPLCAGIVGGFYFPSCDISDLLFSGLYILLFIAFIKIVRLCPIRELLFIMCLYLIGCLSMQYKLFAPNLKDGTYICSSGEVISYPVKKDRYTKMIIRIDSITAIPFNTVGYIFTADTLDIRRGDRLQFKGKIKTITNGENSDFDYKEYCKKKYTRYISFIGKNNYKVIRDNDFSLIAISSHIRDKLTHIVNNIGIDKQESGILNAMLFGIKDDIDKEIKENYIKSGIIHVLAISGLHIGIIFIIINYSLIRIFRITRYSITYTLLCLLMLWTYALITGLPDSVNRAAGILSLVVISGYFGRGVNYFNAVALTAFVTLLIDPGALFSVGFQLSYSAYLSIIYFFPKINKLLKTDNRILRGIWQISAVSLTAQLGTMPLTIYYFHHVYVYSLLTNLCISSFIPWIIYGGLATVAVCAVFGACPIISLVPEILLKLINKITKLISSLPYASSSEIQLPLYAVMIIYLCIGILVIIIERSQKSKYLTS